MPYINNFTLQLEIIETDEHQVAALIEELTRGLDEGQFNLSCSGILSGTTEKMQTKRSPPQPLVQTSPSFTSVLRTPSKVKRQPAPTF